MRGVPFAGPLAASSESCPRPIFPSAAAVHASSKRRERRAVESAGGSEPASVRAAPSLHPFGSASPRSDEPATADPPSDPRLRRSGRLSARPAVQFLRAADSKKQTATASWLSLSLLSSLSRDPHETPLLPRWELSPPDTGRAPQHLRVRQRAAAARSSRRRSATRERVRVAALRRRQHELRRLLRPGRRRAVSEPAGAAARIGRTHVEKRRTGHGAGEPPDPGPRGPARAQLPALTRAPGPPRPRARGASRARGQAGVRRAG